MTAGRALVADPRRRGRRVPLYPPDRRAPAARTRPTVRVAQKALDVPAAEQRGDRARRSATTTARATESRRSVALRHADADSRRPADEDDLAALVPARPAGADLLRRVARLAPSSSPTGSTRAYARCGPKGTLATVRHLTGLPVNYLITVNFHGFKEVVDKLGGIWMDVDRRYYNKNTGSYYNELREHQPAAGLPEAERPAGARLRPLPPHRLRPDRIARQQEFVARSRSRSRTTSRTARSRASSTRSPRTSRSARAAIR